MPGKYEEANLFICTVHRFCKYITTWFVNEPELLKGLQECQQCAGDTSSHRPGTNKDQRKVSPGLFINMMMVMMIIMMIVLLNMIINWYKNIK